MCLIFAPCNSRPLINLPFSSLSCQIYLMCFHGHTGTDQIDLSFIVNARNQFDKNRTCLYETQKPTLSIK